MTGEPDLSYEELRERYEGAQRHHELVATALNAGGREDLVARADAVMAMLNQARDRARQAEAELEAMRRTQPTKAPQQWLFERGARFTFVDASLGRSHRVRLEWSDYAIEAGCNPGHVQDRMEELARAAVAADPHFEDDIPF